MKTVSWNFGTASSYYGYSCCHYCDMRIIRLLQRQAPKKSMLCKVIYQMHSLYSKDHSGQKIQFCNVHSPNVTPEALGKPYCPRK